MVQNPFLNPNTPFTIGVELGRKRLLRHDVDVDLKHIQPTLTLAADILQERADPKRPTAPRAIELFAESIAVASAMRHKSQESQLTRIEIEMCLSIFSWLFNDWWIPAS